MLDQQESDIRRARTLFTAPVLHSRGENKVQETSAKFASCGTIKEKEKCRLKALFSSLSAQEKQEVLSYAESLLNSRKE